MTPLHWAAYHNDFKVVEILLQNDAIQSINRENSMPVDIAAICKNHKIVKLFADSLNEKFDEILHKKAQLDSSDSNLVKTHEDTTMKKQMGSIFPPIKGQSRVANDVSVEDDTHSIVLYQAENQSDYKEIERTVFWCAYFGWIEYVRSYLQLNLSPLAICF